MRFAGQNTSSTTYSVRAQSPGDAKMHFLAADSSFDFSVPDDEAAEIRTQLGTLSGVTFQERDATAHAILVQIVDAAAVSDTAIHAAVAGNAAANLFPGPITDPDVPRAVKAVAAASYDGGALTIVGTNQFDADVTEVITPVAGSTVEGDVCFKTITSITKATVGANAAAVSVGTTAKLGLGYDTASAFGLCSVAGTMEAVTIDATNDTAEPTTAPNGSVDFDILINA